MNIIISLIYAFLFIILSRKTLAQKAGWYYIAAIIIDIITIIFILTSFDHDTTPRWIMKYLLGPFALAGFPTALFIIIMYTGCFKGKNSFIRHLYVVRGELSIIACIFTFMHNIVFGMFFFVPAFDLHSDISIYARIATFITIIMIAILIPLMITSFRSVRKNMSAIKWKKLQKFAYVFYVLLYIHIMLIFISEYMRRGSGIIEMIIYSVIFITYYILRIYKKYSEKKFIRNT